MTPKLLAEKHKIFGSVMNIVEVESKVKEIFKVRKMYIYSMRIVVVTGSKYWGMREPDSVELG